MHAWMDAKASYENNRAEVIFTYEQMMKNFPLAEVSYKQVSSRVTE